MSINGRVARTKHEMSRNVGKNLSMNVSGVGRMGGMYNAIRRRVNVERKFVPLTFIVTSSVGRAGNKNNAIKRRV